MINQTRIILNSIWSNGGILSRCLIWIPSVALGLVLAGCAGSPPRTPEPPPAPVPLVQKKPPRLGLALGGGAARGCVLCLARAAAERMGGELAYTRREDAPGSVFTLSLRAAVP